MLPRAPTGVAHWLCALDVYLSSPQEVVIIGERSDQRTRKLLRAVHERYLPNKVLAGADAPPDGPAPPLLMGREVVGGQPTAYVCEHYACQLPVTTPEALTAQLQGAQP
jgi:uncharacterized protein YyaL (SSP411 family)